MENPHLESIQFKVQDAKNGQQMRLLTVVGVVECYMSKSLFTTIIFLPLLALFSLLRLKYLFWGLSNLLEEGLRKCGKLQGNSNHSLQFYQQKSFLLRETHGFIDS
uniref:Uncharacterized protein n=1 Tax=Micrurus carvalhoi TaxID=3147026 RepID=A0A2H6MZ88_9SAUR